MDEQAPSPSLTVVPGGAAPSLPPGPLTRPGLPPWRPSLLGVGLPHWAWAVCLVAGVLVLTNVVSVPVLLLMWLAKLGPTALAAQLRQPATWMGLFNSIDLALLTIPCNLIGFGLVTWLGWLTTRHPAREVFPFRAVAPLLWAGMAVTFVGGFLTANLASDLLLKVLPMPQWVIDFYTQFLGKDQGATSFFLLAIVAPLTEEFLFRGLIAWGLSRRFGMLPVCLISAALFGGMHVMPWQVVPAFLLGVLFAWWRLASGSLWPSLVAHFITNSLAFFTGQHQSVKEAVAAPSQAPALSLLGLVILAAGFVWCRTLFRRAAERSVPGIA